LADSEEPDQLMSDPTIGMSTVLWMLCLSSIVSHKNICAATGADRIPGLLRGPVNP